MFDWDDEEAIVSQLTCVAIVGIEDPVRDEVGGAQGALSLTMSPKYVALFNFILSGP